MKYFIISDLHIEFYEAYAVEPQRARKVDPHEN